MEELKIEYLPVNSLTPYENNAKIHEDYDIDAICESIKKFGFNDAIGIWGKDNIIVEGHGRYLACKRLGITLVPCVRLDHLTDEERKAYALAHNKTAELSNWNWDLLKSELEELTEEVDMALFGFKINDDEIINDDKDFELQEKENHEKEIECPYCGKTILL